jgi:hypothetical protein
MDKRDKYTIIHSITCINPKTSYKSNQTRELNNKKITIKESKFGMNLPKT